MVGALCVCALAVMCVYPGWACVGMELYSQVFGPGFGFFFFFNGSALYK